MPSPLATALMSAEALPKTNIAPTNVVGAYQMAHDAAMDQYKAKLAQKNALWGGLASLAGTLGGAALFGPVGAALGGGLGKWFGGAVAPKPYSSGTGTDYTGTSPSGED